MERSHIEGISLAEVYYNDYGGRARALKKEGRGAMGYLSAIAPIEIISAAGYIPVRIRGNPGEAITKAGAMMETLVCPYVLSAFDATLKGNYDYLEGLVIPHTCDSVTRTYEVWKRNLPFSYFHFLNVPHLDNDGSLEFFIQVLRTFMASLERIAGKKVSREDLARMVSAYNEQRRAMRDLYEMRKPDQPLISGVEMMRLLTAVKAMPVEESTALIRQVGEEVKNRKTKISQKPLRIMIVGDQIDDTTLVEIIENTGARVVMDDVSVGSKSCFADMEATDDPIDGIAAYYLKKVPLPTFYRDRGATYEDNLEMRFGHMKRFISDFRVDGVILFVYRNCDPYGLEVPAAMRYIESLGSPVFYMEDDYSPSSPARLRTRIEAFLEMLG